MDVLNDFPESYAAGRRAFRELCAGAGLAIESWRHPQAGPDGEALTVDVARAGEPGAKRLLFVCSGTHGVEGFCGSGVQLALLRRGLHRRLPPGIGLVLVHALNPYGFAWLRRTDERNIDLNRNFVDHEGPYPDHARYEEVHDMLVPSAWEGPARREADRRLARYIEAYGPRALQAVVSRGQYKHADGLFFGGREPAWSNATWREILKRYAGSAGQLAVLDVHTGLGERGACELISGAAPGGLEHELAKRWFGGGIVLPGADSTAPASQGYMGESLSQTLPGVAGALVVAEFGTVPFERILEVLRADNWIHLYERPGSRLWREVKAAMHESFVGQDPAWRDTVLGKALEIYRHAAAALADPAGNLQSRANGEVQ